MAKIIKAFKKDLNVKTHIISLYELGEEMSELRVGCRVRLST